MGFHQYLREQHDNMWERVMASYKWVHHLPQVKRRSGVFSRCCLGFVCRSLIKATRPLGSIPHDDSEATPPVADEVKLHGKD